MPAAPPPAPGASRKPRMSPSRKPKPRKNWPMRTAPDVSTVAHAARLAKRFPPEQLGLSKTCTRVDWGDGADARADGDADATLDHLSERVVRLSATRAALSSLGALARAAHLNGWRLVVGGADDEAAEIFWCCRVGDLDVLLRELRAKHTLVRERTRALSFKTAGWVNGERVPSTVVAPPRRPTPREANIGADPADRRPVPPEDFDGDVAKWRAARRASAGTAPSPLGTAPLSLGTLPVPVEDASSSGRLPRRLRLRVAKFPGAHDVCGKVRFSRLMNRAAHLYPSAFAFWPRALILPDDWLKVGDAFADAAAAASPWHIVKPDKGSQGAGIFLVDAPLDLELRIRRTCKEALYSASMGGGLFGGGIGAGATSARDVGAVARGAPARRASRGSGFGRGSLGSRIDGSGTRGVAPGGADPRDASRDPHAPGFVVQRYLDRPLLMGGLKFDLRLYVLVLGTEGFPAFLSKEGLARFCTAPYAAPSRANRDAERSFLTNYALNKKSEAFARSNAVDGGDGSKRSVASVMSELAEEGADVDALWRRVETLVASTVAAMRHALVDAATNARVNPEMCFQVFGFDVILDESLKPHLLEVNAGPSLAMDAVVPVDGGKETERGRNLAAYRGKEPGPGSIAAFQSKALRFCADLDVVPAPCYCKDHAGAHAHEISAVDAHVKSAALAGALEIVRLAQRGILDDAEKGETSPAAFGGFRRAGSRVGWWIDRDDAERPKRTKRTSTPAFGERVASRDERGDGPEPDEPDEPEPKIESREETASTETTEMTETRESETGPAAGDRLEDAAANDDADASAIKVVEASVAGSIPGGDGVGVARVSTVSDEVAGASLDALLERARRALARVVDTRDASSTSRRECSYSKVRRLVSLCRKPSRDGVASKALSNSELDILLQPWRARRNRADTAFEHFLDLVIALAEKFHARLEGADAVRAMLDTFDDVHCAVLVPQR